MKVYKPSYPMKTAMEYAVAVNDYQGFISSGNGWYDRETYTNWYDNKTLINLLLTASNDDEDIHVKAVRANLENDTSIQSRSNAIIEHFQQSLTFKKLSSTLNGFEERVASFIMNENIDAFGISVAASLPQSFKVDQKRELFNDKMDSLRSVSDYVGNIGERVTMDVTVLDMKFLRNFGSYIVTTVAEDKNIIKFFWNKDPDLSKIFEGKTISINGRVKNHELSKYTNCKETVLNYMKILEIKG